MAKKAQTTTKTSTSTSTNLITGKSIGQNIILVIDGIKHTKAFKEKADRESILTLVERYNKKNTKKGLNEILEFMLKDKAVDKIEKVKEKVKEAKKPVKKPAPKKAETMTIATAKAFLEKNDYNVSKKSHTRRSGEY